MELHFIEMVIAFVALVGLLWGIFTTQTSETIRFFAISLVGIGIIVIYLFFLEQRIKKLEGVK